MRFKDFINEADEKIDRSDLEKTLKKIPKSHRKLLRGYKYYCQAGNTLKDDNGSIGFNHLHKKHISVAAPWNYGREFALLHEIGHTVWMKYMEPCAEMKKKWQDIVNKTKHKLKQNAEEQFCHAYANTYAKNKIEVHDFPEWEKFIKSLPN